MCRVTFCISMLAINAKAAAIDHITRRADTSLTKPCTVNAQARRELPSRSASGCSITMWLTI